MEKERDLTARCGLGRQQQDIVVDGIRDMAGSFYCNSGRWPLAAAPRAGDHPSSVTPVATAPLLSAVSGESLRRTALRIPESH
jgi:hypothetical protein